CCCCLTVSSSSVCQGMSNQLSLLGSREHHYDNMVRMFSNCSVVLENLEVTYSLEHQDLSFLQSIQEVGGYVLIAMNEAATIPLVNLRLIRGQNLYEDQYALLVVSNYNRNFSSTTLNYTSGLRQLQLSSLTEILKGGVKMAHNPLLCNVESVRWGDLLDGDSQPSMLLKLDAVASHCEKCHSSCVNGSCWAAGPDHCQTFTKLLCAEQCSRRCRGPKPIDCCNEHCAAGCTGPRATDCLACRAFNDDGTCKDTCPPLKLYDPKTHQVVDNPNAKFTFGATCVKACPHNYVVTDGSCVRTCGAGMYEVEEHGVQRCRPCDGACPKACDGVGVGSLINTIAVNDSNLESFRSCTKINGNIILLEISFTGDPHYNIPPMDPQKLEYFRTVKEITGYLLIQSWPKNLTSLSVFENLEIIRGRSTYSQYSLVLVKLKNLRWLGLRSLKEISAGKVVLKDNLQLCYTGRDQWTRVFRSSDQNVKQQNRTCDQQCTEVGCWGPGPSMCVFCRHLDRRGRCVQSCNLLQGEPREVEVNSSCVQCHAECLLRSGTPTCFGPGPDQCSQCAHFKDGPHCVTRCPHGVQGGEDTLIWKYADGTGQCQPCHQNCTQGCSGPGLSGCSSAATHSTLAVGVVGGLLVAVIVSLVVFVLLRRRRIRRKRTMRRLLQERELVEPLTPSGQAPNQALLRILKETEFKKVRVLGSGAFGTVFKGLWIPEGENVKIPVAIKVLREATSPKANKEILDVRRSFPRFIASACCFFSSSVSVFIFRYFVCVSRLVAFCVLILCHISCLWFCILIFFSSFGGLLFFYIFPASPDFSSVPIKWMALESIQQWTYTHQSDVWSYGVTVWELMTFGSKPYDGIPASEIASVLERGERLPQPPVCTIDVYMIMVKCWMIDPSSRPRFRELMVEFSKMASDPSRYLVVQGEPPSPSDSRFYSRLLSTGDAEDAVDADEYLLPCKGLGNHDDRRCGATNGHPARQNSVALRYITDPTHGALDRDDFSGHDYMNQTVSETSRSSRLSEVLNPNYEDLSLGRGAASLPSPLEDLQNSDPVPSGPEYLNDSLDSPDYRADRRPQTAATAIGGSLFLPAAENLEYLGLGAALHAPVR
uniref:Receptor protein-tyrosine kinase n=1 Tax=Stegastes partitus TaxID=144197 RepID=A0A3B5ARF5_9TELE